MAAVNCSTGASSGKAPASLSSTGKISQAHWLRPAGARKRIAATAVDLLGLLILGAGIPYYYSGYQGDFEPEGHYALALAASLVLIFLYASVQFSLLLTTGQSLGKRLMRIRIVSLGGALPSAGTLLLRETLGRLLGVLTLGMAYVAALWDPEARGLHDRLAGTRVVLDPLDMRSGREGRRHSTGSTPTSVLPFPLTPRVECPSCHAPILDFTGHFCPVCGCLLGQPPLTSSVPVGGTPLEATLAGDAHLSGETPLDQPPMEPVTAQLVTYSSKGEKEVYSLTLPITRIGRHPDNHICFPREKAISSFHCEIAFQNGRFFIRDVGSTNGVLLNNQKVQSAPLENGDKIKLGFKIFRFSLE